MLTIVTVDETDSTNQWAKRISAPTLDFLSGGMPCEGLVVVTDYQNAGRGCGTNTWESEREKNLLFSIKIKPHDLPADRQFHLSMVISVAISETLEQYIGDVSIKWPNDIYWRDGKIGGILIEHTLQGNAIKESIIGVGLNVNQQQFVSDAPNPVSLWQISHQETDRKVLLNAIIQRFFTLLEEDVRSRYMSRLYRRRGYHPYVDGNGPFMAQIADIKDDGRLVLLDDNGTERTYAFKEVQFVQ